MARVHFVKKARKDNPVCKKGESYYWWKHRYGPKRYSKERPRASETTQSEFLSQIYGLQEQIEDLEPEDAESLKIDVEAIAEEIRSLGEECEDKKSNMPDGLQEGEVGYLLESRYEACEQFADELENVDFDIDEEELKTEARDELGEAEDSESDEVKELFEDKKKEKLEEILCEVQGIEYSGD